MRREVSGGKVEMEGEAWTLHIEHPSAPSMSLWFRRQD